MLNEYIEVRDLGSPSDNPDIHIIPMFDGEPLHDGTNLCWCEPELSIINVGEQRVWTHRRPN